MKVALVCYEGASTWILGKLALCLRDELLRMGIDARVLTRPDAAADINHHIIYTGVRGIPPAPSTTMITHVDTLAKVELLRSQMNHVEMGICLSTDTVRKLVALGMPEQRLCAINYPSPQAGRILERRIHIGVTSNVYEHGSKREYLLGELARHLVPGVFTFHFMGRGWEAVVHELRARGSEVIYHRNFDERLYRQLWTKLDYYVYLGQDEGSTGLLDALEAGVRTIVTPQGFHLDFDGGITHAVTDFADLKRVFAELAREKMALRSTVKRLSWQAYAREHARVWERILQGGKAGGGGRRGRASRWPLPAMPPEPGPGGAVHRPRLLLVTGEDVDTVVAKWTSLGSAIRDLPTLVVKAVGEDVDLESLRTSPRFEVRVAHVSSWSPSELATLSLDFDCVAFWNCISPAHLDSLRARRKPNFLMRSGALRRLGAIVVGSRVLERRVGPAFFGYIRRLAVESRAKVVGFVVGPDVTADLRGSTSETAWKEWWSAVDLAVHSDENLPNELAAVGIDVDTVRVPPEEAAADDWRAAFTKLFEVLASPAGEERPSEALRALRKVQLAVSRLGR